MGRYIIKLTHESIDYYLEWSSVVDAPITYGMSLEEFKKYYIEEYGKQSENNLIERLERVERTGTSWHNATLDDVIDSNRAGDNGRHISKKQIIIKYCFNNEN